LFRSTLWVELSEPAVSTRSGDLNRVIGTRLLRSENESSALRRVQERRADSLVVSGRIDRIADVDKRRVLLIDHDLEALIAHRDRQCPMTHRCGRSIFERRRSELVGLRKLNDFDVISPRCSLRRGGYGEVVGVRGGRLACLKHLYILQRLECALESAERSLQRSERGDLRGHSDFVTSDPLLKRRRLCGHKL